MKLHLFLCFSLLYFGSAFAESETMPVSAIAPGMHGVGKTVFAGTEIEEFEFVVLDIMPNFLSKRDLIIVQLLGEKVEHTNVVAGMSGSPMYIDGKLIGALSYRLGLFNKDPIAGITPIAQMLEIMETEQVRPAELAASTGYNPDFSDMAVGAKQATLEDLVPPYMRAMSTASNTGDHFVPLETPLLFSGFESSAIKWSTRFFSGLGMVPAQGGSISGAEEEPDLRALEPGSAYSVVLVEGDFVLQATGTVTYVDRNRVIGMGHPFLNNGAVALPMGKAKILTTISSLMASTKMAALTEISGTVHQDRTTGVMGVSGEPPKMIPFRVNLKKQFGPEAHFSFRIADDRSLYSLTPLLTGLVVSNAIESARLGRSNQTLRLAGRINLAGNAPIPIRNYYAGSTPNAFLTDVVEANAEVGAMLGALLANHFETPEIESVELNFEALPKKYLALVERVEIDRSSVRPGDRVAVTAFLKEYQGQSHVVRQEFTIPANIEARRISIYAGGGSTLTRLEAQASPQKFRPKTFSHLIKLLKQKRSNNSVFFQVLLPDKGISIEGDELPGLPPSVLSVIQSQKSSGSVAALRNRVIAEKSIQTDYSVAGGRSVWLKVEQKKRR